ncbi:MAG: hypothetical protein ACOX0T_03570 [Pelotomaculum sp.]
MKELACHCWKKVAVLTSVTEAVLGCRNAGVIALRIELYGLRISK